MKKNAYQVSGVIKNMFINKTFEFCGCIFNAFARGFINQNKTLDLVPVRYRITEKPLSRPLMTWAFLGCFKTLAIENIFVIIISSICGHINRLSDGGGGVQICYIQSFPCCKLHKFYDTQQIDDAASFTLRRNLTMPPKNLISDRTPIHLSENIIILTFSS